MKKSKILIAVLAVMAAASSARAEDTKIDFDGKKGVPSFSGLLAQKLAAPEPGIIPARVFFPEDNLATEKALASAIVYARKNKKKELTAGLECLRDKGTPEQKAGFADFANKTAFRFPDVCLAGDQKDAVNKDLIDDGLQWLCESYNDVVEYLSCSKGPDGEEVCDVKLRNILRTSCHWG